MFTMLYQNIHKLITDEASKLLATKKLGIKTDFSITNCKFYLLNNKIQKYE